MNFNKLTLNDVDVSSKRVLTRVDFNVPLDGDTILDDNRITAALPTIRHIIEHKGRLILMSHLGKPKGEVNTALSLRPVATRLEKLLGKKVAFVADCVGDAAYQASIQLKDGDILLIENLRFHREEELYAKYDKQDATTKQNIDAFVNNLARLGEVYVNDAFGAAHRAHASIAGVTKHFQRNICGFLMEKELKYLGSVLENAERPFVAILGGAKVSDKILVIRKLMEKVDTIIIGGGMSYTFLKARGDSVGKSLVDQELFDLTKQLMDEAARKGVKLLFPVDHVVVENFSDDKAKRTTREIDDTEMALDIGPESIGLFTDALDSAKTVIWNGPMGVFERAPFASGTFSLARKLATLNATTIIGGGDSASAAKQAGVSEKITHISTGGGASLELMEGKELPGVTALTDKQ